VSKAKDYVDLGEVTIERVTAKAVLIKRGDNDHWVPLSILESDTQTRVITKSKGKLESFEVQDWFVEKEEIEV